MSLMEYWLKQIALEPHSTMGLCQFIRSKTHEPAAGRGRLRASPVLISLGQGDTCRGPAGAARRGPEAREQDRAVPLPTPLPPPPRARPAPRSLERRHVAPRPAVPARAPSPPRTHGAAAARPGPAPASQPPRSQSLWERAPAPAWPGRGRRAPAAGKGPGGRPWGPGARASLRRERRPAGLQTPAAREKRSSSSVGWEDACAGSTPAPTPTRSELLGQGGPHTVARKMVGIQTKHVYQKQPTIFQNKKRVPLGGTSKEKFL
ncbi:atherin-like [Zalophus californianus]|uniref:Atherin-like n=1 Tax=Zalophus californianus TaxID=9704 RepID=A0A6P9FET2_ZALCA|nr:atherin-like [Zalophus californianus]